MSNKITQINPLSAPLTGSIAVPGDKSISHRAVLFSAMAQGTSRLTGVLDSADVRSSITAVRALGARVQLDVQSDKSLAGEIEGWGLAGPAQPHEALNCGNSGTTVRLLMGVLAPWHIDVELTGDASLQTRPMKRITDPLTAMGAFFEPAGKDTLPLLLAGARRKGALRGIRYDMPVASAQLKTALLLAGIFAEGTTELFEPAPSRNHTELMLPAYGVSLSVHDRGVSIVGGQRLRATQMSVSGDPSSAAFLACAALLIPGSAVDIQHICLSETRIGFVRVLQRMGADITVKNEADSAAEPCGSIVVRHAHELCACTVAAHEIAAVVDELPVLAFVAAHARGITRFQGAGELRVKESDRFAAIVDGLAKLGVRAWCEGVDDLCIEGNPSASVQAGTVFDSQGDHRLAMTWALAGLTGNTSVGVRNFEAVRVSYPSFLEAFERLTR